MSNTPDDQAYWDLVEDFIGRANEACDRADPAAVSAALLHASARFSAFVVAASSLDRKELTEELEPSLQYLTGQFREQLRTDLADYRENYKVYIVRETPDEPDAPA